MAIYSGSETLSNVLLGEHREIEQLMHDVALACETSDNATTQAVWSRFDPALRRHLDWEEEALLPRFEKEHPEDAMRIVQEHALLRQRLLDLGLQIDVRCARKEDIEKFLDALRRHAEAESTILYPWADRAFAEPERRTLLARIRERLSAPVARVLHPHPVSEHH